MAQINRTGTVSFHDASLSVWEEGESPQGQHCGLAPEWERQFKRQVFARIVQTLNRLGWNVGPWDEADKYRCIANGRRSCRKGDLHGHLEISGRSIEFKMWQDLVVPDRKDGRGRYSFDKELHMPYVLRLEMERTRRSIRGYLCNVFSGYSFKPDTGGRSMRAKGRTALESIAASYAESWHFKGSQEQFEREYAGLTYNVKSADGVMLKHCQRVWFFDEKGRCCTGTAYYNINNMWWVACGRFGLRNIASFEIYTICQPSPRVKRNAGLRRKRLEQEMQKAVAAMRFERAAVLRDLLFPNGEQLFMIQVKKDGLYFAANYCGYRSSPVDAGKYSREELRPYLHGCLETDELRAVPVV